MWIRVFGEKKKTKKKTLKTKTQANFLKIESNYQTYYSLLEKFNPEQTVPWYIPARPLKKEKKVTCSKEKFKLPPDLTVINHAKI